MADPRNDGDHCKHGWNWRFGPCGQCQPPEPPTENLEVYPVVVDDCPEAHAIRWSFGNQRFRIGPDYWENREEAESFARMFRHALDAYRAADSAGEGK